MDGTHSTTKVACSRTHRCALRVLATVFLLASLGACTSVGVHTSSQRSIDYGPPAQLQVCVLRTESVSPERIDDLIAAVNEEFATYGIEVVVPWVRPWQRPGFSHESLLQDVVARDLEAPCDRLVAFVDRSAGDFLWGLAMPEVLGSVDDATHTRGFVVANRVSFNQLFMTPSKVTVHEFYHLLGCPHSMALTKCYGQIARLKRHVNTHGDEFFPGLDPRGTLLLSREEVGSALRRDYAAR